MRVSDYIFKRLKEKYGVDRVFMITGGGAMHLNDAVLQSGLAYTCCHHEQACAIAAEGYVRSGKRLGVVNVTTGPGGLNTLTGVMGEWTDSVPVLYISGQVKQSTTIAACPDLPLRQLGDQEVDIISVVKPLTKYAKQIRSVKEVRKVLDTAVYTALSGRPGPVWIDVPMDVQGADMEGVELEEFPQSEIDRLTAKKYPDAKDVEAVVEMFRHAKRPVVIAGHGIRIAGGQDLLRKLVEKYFIPVVTTFNGMDLLEDDHPCFVGRIGTSGSRAGNFTLQNADMVLCVGSRNNIRQTSYNYEYFARGGNLVCVDVDSAEFRKPTVKPVLGIESDAACFLEALMRAMPDGLDFSEYRAWALALKARYPKVLPRYVEWKDKVHPYYFMEKLSETAPDNALFVGGNGTACIVTFQAFKVKKGQRYFWNSGCATMGYDLPAGLGAAYGAPDRPLFVLGGEGSMMMNLQELATIAGNRIPAKIFLLNNNGYISIRQTQDNFFAGRHIGLNAASGVYFPEFERVAKAFGLPYLSIRSNGEIEERVKEMMEMPGPVFCEVLLTENYIFEPKTSSERKPDGRIVSKPLEDLYPFLPREEFAKNMIIPPLKEE